MDTPKIDAQKVTKPIQLLAAWLIGLIVIDAAFLTTCTHIDGWERSLLVVASVLNVPIFLFALFLLQTKFRPELQEDAFYSKYLDSKTNQVVTKSKFDAIDSELSSIKKTLLEQLHGMSRSESDSTSNSLGTRYKLGLNKHLKNFASIRTVLREKGIRLSDVFGADEPPEGAYMALDKTIDFDSKIKAISLAIDCGLDGYGYFNAGEEEIEESILIGGYGLGNDHFPLTNELRELLAANPEPFDLRHFEASKKSNL